VLTWLPSGWEEKLRETKAFQRSRHIPTPAALLQLVLAYAVLRLSLPDLTRWAERQGIARLTFPSLWERLAACLPFLRWAVTEALRQQANTLPKGLVWGPLDATTITLPGSKQRDWLIHLLWADGQPVQVRITQVGGKGTGESLRHWESWPEAVVILA